ncbi:MAG TPA: prolipoprotein diacylglyceryl transferase [Gemmatimonadales bacterium]|jgi:phosphatidylglycerol:prolipoprotein diacylglycerol transferase
MTIPYPRIPPDILHIGPLRIRWYGVMYIVGYVVGYRIIKRRVARGLLQLNPKQLDALIGYLVIGMLAGARIMYAIAYEPGHFLHDPLAFFAIWHGGLSFHGALIGIAVAAIVFARIYHVAWWRLADTLAVAGTPGLFFGRLGNFINGELYGRVTTVPWAMVFPSDPQHLPRHPSQLYEAVVEGLVLFLALRAFERRAASRGWYRPGLVVALFLFGYGTFRFLLEFTRQPDTQLGFVLGPFSMGQVFCAAMVVTGAALFLARLWRPPEEAHVAAATDLAAQPYGARQI